MTNLSDDILDNLSIISSSITLCTLRLDTDELIYSKVGVLRLSSAEYSACAIEERRILLDGSDIALCPFPATIGSTVCVSLCPRIDRERATIEL